MINLKDIKIRKFMSKSDVNIYDNAYGKMSWFYETWLSDVEGIRMLNNNSKK